MKPELEAICTKWENENLPRNGAIRGAADEAYLLGVNEALANTHLLVAATETHDVLKKVYIQLRSGYIANDSHAADVMRCKLEAEVKQALVKAGGKG